MGALPFLFLSKIKIDSKRGGPEYACGQVVVSSAHAHNHTFFGNLMKWTSHVVTFLLHTHCALCAVHVTPDVHALAKSKDLFRVSIVVE